MKPHDSDRIGAAIRKLRLARGWTLAELSAECGIPLSTLSRVELGQNALNYEKLMRLCRALEVDVQGLVAREAETLSLASGRRSVARAGEGEAVRVGVHRGRLAGADLTERSLTPVVLDIVVGSLADHGPMLTLPGEAYLLVLSGAVRLHSQFYAPLDLGEGDAVYFDGRAGHAMLAASAAARVLLNVAGDFQPGA